VARRESDVDRLSISLPREDIETLRELADLTGRPISHIVGQFCKPELEVARQILSLGRAHDPLLWDTVGRLMAEPHLADPVEPSPAASSADATRSQRNKNERPAP
jgi:Ribbon-helix-helix protein, copG family